MWLKHLPLHQIEYYTDPFFSRQIIFRLQNYKALLDIKHILQIDLVIKYSDYIFSYLIVYYSYYSAELWWWLYLKQTLANWKNQYAVNCICGHGHETTEDSQIVSKTDKLHFNAIFQKNFTFWKIFNHAFTLSDTLQMWLWKSFLNVSLHISTFIV